jgi:hypothetical protein
MKKYLFILFFLYSGIAFSQGISLDALRREYPQVNTDSASCAKLYKKMIRSNNADAISTAYRGAITAAMANQVTNKQEKIKLFSIGKKLLEQSIALDSNNIETRFLRFTIQTNCPKALGYNKQISADKQFILKNYNGITSMALKKMITGFLLQSKLLTAIEKQKLN